MKIFNTLTNKKEEFKPIEENKVKIYACGPTVYDYFHLGNARPFIIFDTLRRYLEYRGYEVKFVQNFTDIDDKMIKRANNEGITVKELAERFIKEYYVDAEGLNVKKATVHPRATEVIPEIIDMCNRLIENGYAYEANGDVYFSTKKFKDYGKLSHQPLEDLEAGARIDVSDIKKDPMDFAVWKSKKEGEPYWQSPWGEGRPGWHIECSAMVNKYLGKTIDIHCGGKDLAFPHHENEIAQSEGANGVEFAHYWMHNGYININNKKMSKSLGNFFTVRDLANKFSYGVLRFFMLSAHYRSPINFSDDLLMQSQKGLERIISCVEKLEFLLENVSDTGMTAEEKAQLNGFKESFIAHMDDDLNTADAIADIFDAVRAVNSATAENPKKDYIEYALNILKELTEVLGIEMKKEEKSDADEEKILELIAKRAEFKKQKDYAAADAVRAELSDMGIAIEDTREGVKWKRI